MSFFLFIFLSLGFSQDKNEVLSSFTFGSCNDQTHEQPLWDFIRKDRPQMFLWLGDNIYGDTNKIDELAKDYEIQNSIPGYQKLKEETFISGVWDDHDFGKDNGKWNYKLKGLSQQLFLDFIEVPGDSHLREREGVYQTFQWGKGEESVRFILLDNRYFYKEKKDKRFPVLGEKQWLWLEDVLKKSKARVHFIASGISIIGPKLLVVESFDKVHDAHLKLVKLLNQYKTSGAIFLAGDRHFGGTHSRLGFHELLSSGMTHTTKRFRKYVSRKYNEAITFELNYGHVELFWDRSPLELKYTVKTQDAEKNISSTFRLNNNGKWLRAELKQPSRNLNELQPL